MNKAEEQWDKNNEKVSLYHVLHYTTQLFQFL